MEASDLIAVERFVAECNDMLSGKFLDLGKRLEKLLNVLAESEDIVALLAQALEDFDEDEEFDKAFSVDKNGLSRLSIPTDDKKKLALITTIFNRISSGKTNATQFLETYFQGGKQTTVHNFLSLVIKPYRDAICKEFSIPTNLSADEIEKQIQFEKIKKKQEQEEQIAEQEQQEEESLPHLQELLAEVEKNCNQILSLLKFEKKRTDVLDDVEFVTNSIIKACENKELMVVNGLVIGLNYCSKKFKNIRHLVDGLNGLIYDYYEYLADRGGYTNSEELEEVQEEQEEEE